MADLHSFKDEHVSRKKWSIASWVCWEKWNFIFPNVLEKYSSLNVKIIIFCSANYESYNAYWQQHILFSHSCTLSGIYKRCFLLIGWKWKKLTLLYSWCFREFVAFEIHWPLKRIYTFLGQRHTPFLYFWDREIYSCFVKRDGILKYILSLEF